VYSNQKKNQEAIKALLHAEELDPREPDAHYRLGRVYMSQGDKLKADREFAKTKELHNKTTESLIQKVTGSGDGSPATP
jgi:Flp pilus assembly protein TadD